MHRGVAGTDLELPICSSPELLTDADPRLPEPAYSRCLSADHVLKSMFNIMTLSITYKGLAPMRKLCILAVLAFGQAVRAAPSSDVVCSYAPSQSNVVAAVSGAAGGASATIGAVASATGLTVVTHSSGAMILTGSSGYIAGTIGTAIVAPVIVGVGLVVGGAVVTLELVCASKNHPAQVKQIEEAAEEFSRRFRAAIKGVTVVSDSMKRTVTPVIDGAAVETRRIAENIWQYANRASAAAGNLISSK